MNSAPAPSNLSLAWRAFVRGLLLFLLILLILGAAAAVFYFIVLPMQSITARLSVMEGQLAADRADLAGRLDGLQARLNQIETARTAANADFSAQQGDIASLRKDINSLTDSIARLSQIEADLKTLSDQVDQTGNKIGLLEARFQGPTGELAGLQREVAVLKALNLLTRAQVHLGQSNFGLARDDVALARGVLISLRAQTPLSDLPAVDAWITRLDLALGNLPAYPVVAAGDLEIAYQLMTGAILPPTPTPVFELPGPTDTPTPATWLTETAAALTASPTITRTPWLTGTAAALSATPTPIATFTAPPARSTTATAIPNFTPTPTQ